MSAAKLRKTEKALKRWRRRARGARRSLPSGDPYRAGVKASEEFLLEELGEERVEEIWPRAGDSVDEQAESIERMLELLAPELAAIAGTDEELAALRESVRAALSSI